MVTSRGTLIFKLSKYDDSIVVKQTLFSSILYIVVTIGFLSTTIFTSKIAWIIAWVIISILDFLLEWVIIIFLKKDAIREKHQILESGSIWKGNKSYKVLTPRVINNQ